MAGRGRPTKPYRASWKEDIGGLTRKGDGRWEIRSKGIRFTEPDEFKAVTRAKQILGFDQPRTTAIEVTAGQIVSDLPDNPDDMSADQAERLANAIEGVEIDATAAGDTAGDVPLRLSIPDEILYPWLGGIFSATRRFATNAERLPANADANRNKSERSTSRGNPAWMPRMDCTPDRRIRGPSTRRTPGPIELPPERCAASFDVPTRPTPPGKRSNL